jgi:hypothetical protein
MKRRVKEKWLEDLRSVRYKQGIGRLRRGNRFCCLGVLADQLADDWKEDHGDLIPVKGGKIFSSRSGTILNESVLDWADQNHLAEMNDSGASFETIAREIESLVPVDPE